MPFRQAILQRTFQTNLFTSDHQRTLSACCHNAPCMMRHFIYTCDFNGTIPKFPFLPCPLSQRLAVHLRTPAGNAHLGVHHRHDRVTKVELVISFQCHSRCAVFRNWRWEVRALLTFLVQVEFLGSHGQRLRLTPGDRVSAPHRQARRLGSRTRRRSRRCVSRGRSAPPGPAPSGPDPPLPGTRTALRREVATAPRAVPKGGRRRWLWGSVQGTRRLATSRSLGFLKPGKTEVVFSRPPRGIARKEEPVLWRVLCCS